MQIETGLHNADVLSDNMATAPVRAIQSYSKEKIQVIGQFHATGTHEGHSAACSFMVVESGAALIGLNLFVALHTCIEGNKVLPSTKSNVSTDPGLTAPPLIGPVAQVQEVGCANGFVHKIQLKSHTIPVQQKPKRLPFMVKDVVTEEL